MSDDGTTNDKSTEASERPLSRGYPTASEGLEPSPKVPSSSGEAEADDGPENGGADPYEVLRRVQADAESRDRERERRLNERRFVPTEPELLEEVGSWREEDHPQKPASHQIGVRLRPEQWDRLLMVAAWSGIRPTTMARLLINRGARAIVDEELRYWRQLGPAAD